MLRMGWTRVRADRKLGHREMKRFEVRVNNSRKQQRLKGPDSDSSDEDAVVSS